MRGTSTIRMAVRNDLARIQQIVRSLSHYYLQSKSHDLPLWLEQILSIASFEERFNNNGYSHLVFVMNDVIVGYLALKDRDYVYHLFVDEAFHKQGIAGHLWQYALDHVLGCEVKLRGSLYAVPVYEKWGFKCDGSVLLKDGLAFQPMIFKR